MMGRERKMVRVILVFALLPIKGRWSSIKFWFWAAVRIGSVFLGVTRERRGVRYVLRERERGFGGGETW